MPMIGGGIGEVFAGNRIVHRRIDDRVVQHDSEWSRNSEPWVCDPHISFYADTMIVVRRIPVASNIKQAACLQVHGAHVGNGPCPGSGAIKGRDRIWGCLDALRDQAKAEIDGHELELV